MSMLFVILAVLLFGVSVLLLFRREMLGPVAAFLAFGPVYLSGQLPMNVNMLVTWLCLTLVVTGVSALQPMAVMSQTRGMGYMSLGALAGMIVGMMAYSLSHSLGFVYSMMCLGVLAGVFLGYLLFTRTPKGMELSMSRSRFFSYLLAKGFPVAVSAMMLGVVAILYLFVTDTLPLWIN